mmetsp:Transcript_107062/g.160050  ORF Transcript_107062/g.160050 Transcript_107062/m.160050 type:complete len:106 (-) Transcript_107062:599-916(-)
MAWLRRLSGAAARTSVPVTLSPCTLSSSLNTAAFCKAAATLGPASPPYSAPKAAEEGGRSKLEAEEGGLCGRQQQRQAKKERKTQMTPAIEHSTALASSREPNMP